MPSKKVDVEKTVANETTVKSEVEILATALADSNREANSSNKNTVRVLGTLLALSVLGNFALAGINIGGRFFGTNINMGVQANPYIDADGDGLLDIIDEDPPEDWCAENMVVLEVEDIENWYLCGELYPGLLE